MVDDNNKIDEKDATKNPDAAAASSGGSSSSGDHGDCDNGAATDRASSADSEPPQPQDPSQQSSPEPQPQPPLPLPLVSKTQQKKLRKRQLVAAKRRERKLRDREARRRKAEAEGRDWHAEAAHQHAATLAGTSPWRMKRQREWDTVRLPLARQSFQIGVDCAFDELMTAKEIASLASQLRYCHAANQASPHPCLWAATGLLVDDPQQKKRSGTTTLQELTRQDPNHAEWSRRGFTGTARSLSEYYRDHWPSVVYLTSDAGQVLETLDDACVYVIGGMVDRNRLKGAARERARQLGLKTARLPLDEHLHNMPSTRVLTCNHVFELLLQCRQQHGDWAAALQKVLPRRKEAKFKRKPKPQHPSSSSLQQQQPKQAEEEKQKSREDTNPNAELSEQKEPQSKEKEPLKAKPQSKEPETSAAGSPLQQHSNHGDDEASLSPPPQEDDWGLPMDFHVFARHQPHPVHFDAARKFDILCVEALTPVDMANLGSTGHCVWTGACYLVAATAALSLQQYFAHRRVLELGCGTGIGGLSLLLQQPTKAAAAFVALTDSDPEALALCRRNCHLNELSDDRYAVFPLTWGQEPLPSEVTDGKQPFDTVLATDVLYDIGLLAPLFQTAAACLSTATSSSSDAGYFVLAHVPRACYNSQNPPVDDLEGHIVERARAFDFSLERLVRPRDLLLLQSTSASCCQPERDFPSDALNRMSLQEMQEIGAAIFVFQRTIIKTE